MLFRLINSIKSRNGRRVAAAILLILMPFIVIASLIWGTILTVGGVFLALAQELYTFIRYDVAAIFKSTVNTIKTGAALSAH